MPRCGARRWARRSSLTDFERAPTQRCPSHQPGFFCPLLSARFVRRCERVETICDRLVSVAEMSA